MTKEEQAYDALRYENHLMQHILNLIATEVKDKHAEYRERLIESLEKIRDDKDVLSAGAVPDLDFAKRKQVLYNTVNRILVGLGVPLEAQDRQE